MKRKKIISIFVVLATFLCNLNIRDAKMEATAADLKLEITDSKQNTSNNTITDPTQFIGYGYNVTAGKPISDTDALYLNSPILDVDNEQLKSRIRIFNTSQTIYVSGSSKKASEISESYGQIMSGGINAGFNSKISKVNVNLGVNFNMNKNTSWTVTQEEEFSYYTILSKNKPVVLQVDEEELSNYLSDDFEREIKNVKTEADANKLFSKYGTHLLTGYTLGGIFELTNYYATRSSNYVRQNETSFNAQVNAGFSAISMGVDFSFASNYAGKDNNSFAVNNYKCTTYGGYAFPGLTIDQAFSWYETFTSAGYVYDIWTDSINRGDNLVIVEIPQSSKMIPLWDLLPSNEKYNISRDLLIENYRKNCSNAYKSYSVKYPDIYASDVFAETKIENEFEEVELNGYYNYYEVDSKFATSYVSIDEALTTDGKSNIRVHTNNRISLDFDISKFVGRKVEWKANSSSATQNVYIEDSRNGIITFKHRGEYILDLFVDEQKIGEYKFLVIDSPFAGGFGTEKNPYLISNANQLFSIEMSSAYHYKLINNIIINRKITNTLNFYSNNKEFKGVFDGNYHKIIGLKLAIGDYVTDDFNKSKSDDACGLFSINSGTIKNLTISDFVITNDDPNKECQIEKFGILVGVNNGTIENCIVESSCIRSRLSKLEGYVVKKDYRDIFIGGVVGYNKGKIIRTTINNSEVSQIGTETVICRVHVGGLVGHSQGNTDNNSLIEGCSAFSNYIYGSVGKSDAKAAELRVFIGGLVGTIYCTDVKYSLSYGHNDNLSDIQNNRLYETGKGIVASHIADGSNTAPKNYIGGLIGFVAKNDDNKVGGDKTDKSTIEYCYSFDNSSKMSTKSDKGSSYIGNLLGGVANNVDFSKLLISDNGVYTDETFPLIIGTKDNNDDVYCVRTGFNGKISSVPQEVSKKYFSNLTLSILSEKPIDLFFDYSYTKTIFDKSKEDFSYQDIKLYYILNTNDELIADTDFFIDYSSYSINDNSNKIKLSSSVGVKYEEDYTIEYKKFNEIGIKAEFVEEDKTYYIGNKILASDIIVNAILEDTSEENIDINNVSFEGLTEEGILLHSEFNEIVITYGDFTTVLYVKAKQKTVIGIAINEDTLPDQDNHNYNVGDSNINVDNMVVNIYYLEDQSEEFRNIFTSIDKDKINYSELKGVKLDRKEYELIFSTLHYGENNIIVSYDYEHYTNFKLNVSITKEDNKIDAFIKVVDEYENYTTIPEKFRELYKAGQLLGDIEQIEGIENSEELKIAIAKYEMYAEEYNNEVNGINEDYFTSVESSSGIQYSFIYDVGGSVLSKFIELIRKAVF